LAQAKAWVDSAGKSVHQLQQEIVQMKGEKDRLEDSRKKA
jgi:hypothetical protein